MVKIMLEEAKKIFDELSDIKYGWYDKNKVLHEHIYEGYLEKYKMQTNEELEKNRIGVCWETVELSRKKLTDIGLECHTYFFVLAETGFHSHSILVFKYNDKYYWFEETLKKFNGMNEYNTLDEILDKIIDNYNIILNKDNVEYNKKNIKVYEYTKPKDGCSCFSYYTHCFMGKRIR